MKEDELQEFLPRGIIHENLRRIFVGKNKEVVAIIISSLMFGTLHIHRGFMYMIDTTALLSIFVTHTEQHLGAVHSALYSRRSGLVSWICLNLNANHIE